MASNKIVKQTGAPAADEFELSVAQALIDLESSVPDLKGLKALQITAAKEVSHPSVDLVKETERATKLTRI